MLKAPHTFSMTSLDSWMGLAMLRTAATAPQASVCPSISSASISTSPLTFSTEPHPEIGNFTSVVETFDRRSSSSLPSTLPGSPALNMELFSSCTTASTTASTLLAPSCRSTYPARAAAQTPRLAPSDLSAGITPAPPWTTTTGNILVTVDKPTHNWSTCSSLGSRQTSRAWDGLKEEEEEMKKN